MIEVVPFIAAHARAVLDSIQPMQAGEHLDHFHDWADIERLSRLGAMTAFTAMRRDGTVLACAGSISYWPGRGAVWAMISMLVSRAEFLAIHRRLLEHLRLLRERDGMRRIEATCLAGWGNGRRWLDLLGFGFEGVMRAYAPDGQDHALYARVRE